MFMPCSLSLFSRSPSVSNVPKTGTFISLSTYGNAPIWSSCPCVSTIPLILSIFLTRYEISGITKSIPSISSSGKARPQSTIIISLSYSKTVIFFPISCNPPKDITFNFGFFEAKKTPPVLYIYKCFHLLFKIKIQRHIRHFRKVPQRPQTLLRRQQPNM